MGRYKIGFVGTDFDARHWLSLDPCGLICLSFSYGLHLFALIASGLVLISHHALAQCLYGFLYAPLSALALWSLAMASTTDPGAVPMGASPLQSNLDAGEDESVIIERDDLRGGLRRRRGIRRCRKCNDNYKPGRAHHDSVTGRCIIKMDHFCPWVGNAIGIMNHKFFILFIMYTFLTSIVSLALILIRVIRCKYYVLLPPSHTNSTGNATLSSSYLEAGAILRYRHSYDHSHVPPPHLGCDSNHTTVIFVLSIITILFFFFTFCMLLEQTEAISTNMSKIARMKTRGGMVSHPNEYAPVATEFNEVFGGEHPTMSWHWILPLPVRFPEWAMDNIMGFEYNVTREGASGPYREPSETDGENSSVISMSSGMSSSLGDGGGMVGMDIERGTTIQRELVIEEEGIDFPPTTLSGEGVKKRPTSGLMA